MTAFHYFDRAWKMAISAAIAASFAFVAQAQDTGKKTLAICEITPEPGLAANVQAGNKKNELDRVVQSLDGQLIDRMQNTRKFAILAHSDLPAIIRGGVLNPGTLKDVPNLDYVLVASVDDFDDTTVPGDNNQAFRNIRLSVVAKIYDASTGKIKETANIQIPPSDLQDGGVLDDRVLVQAARKMADLIANRVTYVIYPPRVLDVTGNQVTINWGDGLFITKGEEWEVCTSKEKTNPDGGSTIRVLTPVGKIKITRVDPITSTGEIVGENLGIAEGCVLRKP